MEDRLSLLCILLLSSAGAALGIEQFPGILGGSVLLAGEPTQLINHKIEWKLQSGTLIASLSPSGSQAYYDTCRGRCVLFQNATLKMSNLQSSDQRYYSLTIYDYGTLSGTKETFELKLYNHVTTPTMRIYEPKEPVSGRRLTLQCDAGDQKNISYSFMYNSQPIDCDTSPITCREYSPFLYFNPVAQSHSGAYTCEIRNPVSSTSSYSLYLRVNGYPSGRIQCGAERILNYISLSCSWLGGYPSALVDLVYPNHYDAGPKYDKVTINIYPRELGKVLTCSGYYMGSSDSCSLAIDTPQSNFKNNSVEIGSCGKKVVITIQLETIPQTLPAKFSWYHESDFPITTGSTFEVDSSDYRTELVIRSYNYKLGGKYICRATNNLGSTYFHVSVKSDGPKRVAGMLDCIFTVIPILIGIITNL